MDDGLRYLKKSFFITLEGGEGAGKTTQINRLADSLTQENYKVITTREPGGTPEGELLRSLLVKRGEAQWSPLSEVLLILAARSLHVETVIKPALESGKIVICDRFSDSTLAYQGYGRGVPIEQIKGLASLVIGDLRPDMTFILDVDPHTGLGRSNKRLTSDSQNISRPEDRFEKMETSFHEAVRNGFLAIAQAEPKRCVVLDAQSSIDDIALLIRSKVFEKL